MDPLVRLHNRRVAGWSRVHGWWGAVAVLVIVLVGLGVPTTAYAAPGDTTVSVLLRDSSGTSLDVGSVSYYSGGWYTLGATSGGVVTAQLPPGTYSFAMVYNGTRQQRNGVVISGAATSVPFQTAAVTVSLKNSSGNPLDGGVASYFAAGWYPIGTTAAGIAEVQMLPGSYAFRMAYNGTNQQLNAVTIAGTTASVAFQTVVAAVLLKDSSGNPLDGGDAAYYASQWNPIGTTTGGVATAELLPGSYAFRMVYQGATQQQNANVSSTSGTVVFQTVAVTVSLLRDPGSVPVNGGIVSYYAGGWRALGTTAGGSVSAQLLPGTYPFAMAYYWTNQQQNALLTVGTPTSVMFRTNLVAPQITSGPPADAITGMSYSHTVTATGNPAPQFSVTGRSLPAGLSMDAATGAISGTPTQSGEFTFTVTARNGIQPDATVAYAMTVNAAPTITSGAPPTATAGTAYSFQMTATGYPVPQFALTSGALPNGLTLDATTGMISGTPAGAGTFEFTVSVKNGIDPDGAADYTLTVLSLPTLAATGTDPQPAGILGALLTTAGLTLLLTRRRRATTN